MNNCIRQVPLCQMTVNMIPMLMRTHMRMNDGTNCTETTTTPMTMKTVMRLIPLKCHFGSTNNEQTNGVPNMKEPRGSP